MKNVWLASFHHCSTVAGESFPVGVFVPTWASGRLVSAMVQILIEEQLGFHVQTAEGSGA